MRPFKKHTGGPGPRPLCWLSGPDRVRHDQWVAFGRARCQARFRGEAWTLTFEEYEDLWRGQWSQRGRRRGDLCLSRRDYDQGWDLANVELIDRYSHHLRQKAWKRAHG